MNAQSANAAWLESLPQSCRAEALATLRTLSCRYEPATAGELLALLRLWAYAEIRHEAVLAALRTDRAGALALADAVIAERRAERAR